MELILTSAIDKLDITGDIVEVHNGYGRNYLVPQGKTIVQSRGTEKRIKGIERARDAREVHDVEHTRELHTQIEELTAEVPARTVESGPLFSAVAAANLALAVKKAGGPTVNKRSVPFAKPVKTVGNHVASVKLHPAVIVRVSFEVIPV